MGKIDDDVKVDYNLLINKLKAERIVITERGKQIVFL